MENVSVQEEIPSQVNESDDLASHFAPIKQSLGLNGYSNDDLYAEQIIVLGNRMSIIYDRMNHIKMNHESKIQEFCLACKYLCGPLTLCATRWALHDNISIIFCTFSQVFNVFCR